MRLFICTEKADEAYLDALTDVLDGYRMTVDIDRIIGERDSRPALQAAIQDCEAFVFALTPRTVSSRRCHWEFSQAVANQRPVVIAVLDAVEPYPRALEGYPTANLMAETGAEELLDALYVVGATPPSLLAQLFRNRLLLAIVVLVGFITAYLLAGPYSPYRDQITDTLVGVVQVANRADIAYNPPDPTANPTLIAQQAPLQQMTLSANANNIFREGQDRAREGDYTAAIDAFNRALAITPGAVGAYIARGGAYLAIGERDTAWGDYTRAVELAPSLALPYISRAAFYLAVDEPRGALADAEAALQRAPDDVSALIVRGRAYIALGETANALADFTRATTLDPRSAAALTYRGDAHRAAGDRKTARTDYEAALDVNPIYSRAYAQRGTLRAEDGDSDGALSDFTRAIELETNNPTARAGRGDIYNARGDYPRALADFTRAIIINPADAALYLRRGRAYRCTGQPALAVADFTRAAGLDLNAAAAYLDNPVVYNCVGGATVEIAPERIGATDPNLNGAYLYVSGALAARAADRATADDTAAALADYTRAARLSPSYTEAATLYRERAILYEVRGNQTAALADYTRAADILPERADYQADVGRLLLAAGELERARSRFIRAIERDPSLMAAELGLGATYTALEQPQAALQAYTRALRIEPDNLTALAGRVQSLVILESCPAAAPDAARLTDLAPEGDAAASATLSAYNRACISNGERVG